MKRKQIVLLLVVLFLALFCIDTKVYARTVVSEAEVLSGGDLLISTEILAGAKKANGEYDFDYIFRYVDDYIKEADYAVVNLETSVGGEKLGYQGFPRFNSPDCIIKSAKNAGFDMFLTASNHSYDQGYDAVLHRINVLQKNHVNFVGTRKNSSEYFHKVVKVNGIKIGILNYTRETGYSTAKKTILNSYTNWKTGETEFVVVDSRGKKIISTYNNRYLNTFYETLEKDIRSLKKRGADIIVAYPHWGYEYETEYSAREDKIAQKMCDLGVDVIIGGHPHVVQPVKVYTSKLSGKTTVCIHSTGNLVSSMYVEYTNDGVLFKYKVKKYSDGTSAVSSVDVLPIWVQKAEGEKYTVIPLDRNSNWEKKYGITNHSKFKEWYRSYNRSMNLVSKGIEKYNKMPKICRQPSACSAKSGKKAIFKVSVVGTNVKYQWQYTLNNGKTWKNSTAAGNKTSKLSVTAKKSSQKRYYRCKVTTSAGTAYSKRVKLTVR